MAEPKHVAVMWCHHLRQSTTSTLATCAAEGDGMVETPEATHDADLEGIHLAVAPAVVLDAANPDRVCPRSFRRPQVKIRLVVICEFSYKPFV